MQPRSRYVVINNGYREEFQWHSEDGETVDFYCLVRPSTCTYGNQYAAQFPAGIIINYEEMEIISLDKMECSHMVAQYDSGGKMTNQIYVFANQETCVHWDSTLYLDFMTEKRMTFDESIFAEQRKSLLCAAGCRLNFH